MFSMRPRASSVFSACNAPMRPLLSMIISMTLRRSPP